MNLFAVDKLNAVHLLLDTFGGSRTISNTSTSNFTQLTTLDFDHSGQIVSASIQVKDLCVSIIVLIIYRQVVVLYSLFFCVHILLQIKFFPYKET